MNGRMVCIVKKSNDTLFCWSSLLLQYPYNIKKKNKKKQAIGIDNGIGSPRHR